MDAVFLKKTIDAVMRTEGFVRKGSSWCLSSEEVVACLALRKSTHGNYFYLDVSASLIVGGQKTAVASLSMNALKLVMEDSDRDILAQALDIGLNSTVCPLIFTEVMRSRVLMVCKNYSRLDYLRQAYKEKLFDGALIGWKMREVLEGG
jgi:hypothetical protein